MPILTEGMGLADTLKAHHQGGSLRLIVAIGAFDKPLGHRALELLIYIMQCKHTPTLAFNSPTIKVYSPGSASLYLFWELPDGWSLDDDIICMAPTSIFRSCSLFI